MKNNYRSQQRTLSASSNQQKLRLKKKNTIM